MSNAIDARAEQRHPHTPPTAGPYFEFDLARELERLRLEPAWQNGQIAKTLVKYDDLRVVLTLLKAGARLPRHRSEGRISIHTLAGHIQVRLEGRTFDLLTGGLLTIDRRVPHDVEAVEGSALLLTIA